MKNSIKRFGIIVIVAIIGFGIINCNNDDDQNSYKTVNDAQDIDISVGHIIDGTPFPFGSIRISRTGIGFPVTETISINASDFDSGSIRWEIAGVGHFSEETIIGSGSLFTLNATDVRYNSLGGHTLTLTVRKNGILYQREIPFTIMQ